MQLIINLGVKIEGSLEFVFIKADFLESTRKRKRSQGLDRRQITHAIIIKVQNAQNRI